MIAIVPYQPQWAGEFVNIGQSLRSALGAHALRIDHIGSTAVVGLAAKDKIDIQITISDFAAIHEISTSIFALGYERFHEPIIYDHRPPGAIGPEREWEKSLFTASAAQRPTNIHVRAQGRPNQRYALLFRDYLRTHPVAVGAYAEIKRQLVRYHPDDQEFYYDIKDPVCDVVMAAAEEWAHGTSWQQGVTDC